MTFTEAVENAARAQLISDLQAARQELVKRGRTVQDFIDAEGSVCALGAVGVVTVEGFEAMSFDSRGDCLDAYVRPSRVLNALGKQLLQLHPDSVNVSLFNDADTTTDQDVLDLFEKTLAELGGLA